MPARTLGPMNGTQQKPTVTAVVINYNGGPKLTACVAALSRQSYALQRIVVVDNGSTDGSLEALTTIAVDVVVLELGENLGLTRARNAGLAAAASELVLLCDNDVCPDTRCLEHLVAALGVHGATVACPRIVFHPGRDTVQADGAENHYLGVMTLRHAGMPLAKTPIECAPVNSAIGACYLLDRKRTLEAGGFNELYFFYFEDLEFALRLRSRGHTIALDSRALVYHDRGSGTPGLSYRGSGVYPRRRARLTQQNRLLTIALHYRWRTLLLLGPALVIYELATVGLCIGRGWFFEWLAAWRWVVRHRRAILAQRRINASARCVADGDVLAGGPIPFSEGFLRHPLQRRMAGGLSFVLNVWWRIVRPLL